ncbi:LarC family nickel insertion protein [Brevibacillus brevis]|uniref:LarC family nickel insertion protein n=1 Tax=Brevibacillus brevis TaxID=1393 RepID=A0ABY9T1K9_BREBE|nr:LarC family nickel insertion protein [Brevibacillus brevis]WNC13974.1 LarC family nickel insertion protein [Brevibacillus brevis]
MRIAYLDCFSGISGDMLLAALVDAGADRSRIEDQLRKLPGLHFRLEWRTVVKTGVTALKLDVIDETPAPAQPLKPLKVIGQHDHAHRAYKDIVEMIEAAELAPRVTARALAIFEKIAVAEAKIHGVPVETVHFHEVGALDSIVDVVGIALGLEDLGIDQLYCGPVPTGNGYVRCDHGLYPVPAPATMEMLVGIPLRRTTVEKELTTPTGAGVAAALVREFGPLPAMTVDAIGYGAGTRDLPDQPNVLRLLAGRL